MPGRREVAEVRAGVSEGGGGVVSTLMDDGGGNLKWVEKNKFKRK